MTIDRIHPSEAQLDAELELVTDYVTRTMTDQQAAEFEQSLRDDEELFDRVAPILKVWYSRAPGYTMARTRERVRVRVLSTARANVQQESKEVPPPAAQAPDPKVIPLFPGDTRASRRRRFPKQTHHIVAAAAALPALAAGLMLAMRLIQEPTVAQPPSVTAKAPEQRTPTPTHTPAVAASAVQRPSPRRTERPQVVAVAQPPIAPVAVDSPIIIDSLPAVRAMEIRVEPQFDFRAVTVVQWAPTLPTGKGNRLDGFARAVSDAIGAVWGKIRHPRTHKPTPPPVNP